MAEDSLKRANREKQILTLVQEHFDGLDPKDEEIKTVERELWDKPGLAQEWLCLSGANRTAVNMLYMCIAVANLRLNRGQNW